MIVALKSRRPAISLPQALHNRTEVFKNRPQVSIEQTMVVYRRLVGLIYISRKSIAHNRRMFLSSELPVVYDSLESPEPLFGGSGDMCLTF